MSEQNTRNGNADVFKKAWRGFQGAKWTDEVNVREFIQNNYTHIFHVIFEKRLHALLCLYQ